MRLLKKAEAISDSIEAESAIDSNKRLFVSCKECPGDRQLHSPWTAASSFAQNSLSCSASMSLTAEKPRSDQLQRQTLKPWSLSTVRVRAGPGACDTNRLMTCPPRSYTIAATGWPSM